MIENKDYNMVLLLPHNATKIKYFSKSFSIRFFLLVIKEYYVFLKVAANGQRLELLGGWPPAALSAVKNIINLGKVSVSAKQPQ